MTMNPSNASRRGLLQASGALMAAGFTGTLSALHARQANAQAAGSVINAPIDSAYGPVAPVLDRSTNLPLLQLPEGFRYRSFAWTGDRMADGRQVPGAHDGMAVMAVRASGRRGTGGDNSSGPSFDDEDDRDDARDDRDDDFSGGDEIVLIRNHERGIGADPIEAPSVYDRGTLPLGAGTGRALGGTTNLVFRGRKWVSVAPSLGGTIVNCAGGPTPWGTWLTCEEVRTNLRSSTGNRHGYVFEVRPDAAATTARPIVAMGRFSHEAAAVDPATGYVYLTEDDRNKSTLYRFIPRDRSGRPGSLEAGGTLQAARVVGRRNADLIVAAVGDEYVLDWVDIPNPDLDHVTVTGFPDIGTGPTELSGTFSQAWNAGALRMSRGEGIWYADGQLFIVDTSTGVDAAGRRGRGEGAVWVLDLRTQRLRALFVSGNQLAANNPDNVTVSPRGGVLLCEDGGNSPDAFGPGSRLVGLTRDGAPFMFAKNNVELDLAQVTLAGKAIAPGDYRGSEFCGACWDPRGRVLFVNIQTPGITFAIWGPWRKGEL